MALLLQGLVIGFSLAAMIGPITFTILDSSLSRGWRAGVMAAMGMWISDIIYISLCYLGGQQIVNQIQNHSADSWIGIVAGVVLFGIGVTLWIKRHDQLGHDRDRKLAGKTLVSHAGRGFLVNTFSPFTVIFWPSLVLTKALNSDMSTGSVLLFFGGILIALMTGDTLKSIFAEVIRRRLSDRYIKNSRILFAGVFSCIGFYLVIRAVIAMF